MGKVYEALSRAETEGDDIDLFDEVDEESEHSDRDEPAPRRFNFMRYSLGVGTTASQGRSHQERGTAALVTRSTPHAARDLTISPERLDPHLVSFHNLDPQASQEYNKLALSLISKAAQRGLKRVLVASAQAGEGRTCVTLNLACALARARQRVLVVDCDLLNPCVLRKLGLHCEIGMYEVFERAMHPSAAEIAIRPQGFDVLPTTRPVQNPAELFAAPSFWKMLKTFDDGHDFVLFDSSPLATGGDLSLLVRFTDTTLMVVRAGHTSSAQMAKAISPFSQNDILGVVINRAET